jgi:carbamoylphosphate synthase large subunit
MRTVRVWLNHWFSTAYHIINLLKTDDEINFVVIGSNTDNNCVYRTVCDEWAVEPQFNNSDLYIDFCIDFCRRRNIDVFLPRRNMQAVSRRLSDFNMIGVKALVESDYSLMDILRDKIKTYQLFAQHNIGNIPPYRSVSSVEDFEIAYQQLKTEDNRVCFKFAIDEGAVSFRVIDNQIEHSLTENIGAKITYKDAIKTLSKQKIFHTLLVMPYLSGFEVSVDCLYMPDGDHIIIPRYKSWHRSEEIKFEKDIVDVCILFLDSFKLKYPCNLQFKYDNGRSYLLEVNTRMSGGIQMSCMATGVNIPNIAVNRLLGIEKQAQYDKNPQIVSFIETPVVLR